MATQINKIIHSEINDGQELNRHCFFFKQHLFHPIYSIKHKNGGIRQATERLRIATTTPSTHRRWSCTKQPSWNYSNIIVFQTIYPLEQKLDGRQQEGTLHTLNAKVIPL